MAFTPVEEESFTVDLGYDIDISCLGPGSGENRAVDSGLKCPSL